MQLRRDRGKGGVELRAEAVHDSDNGNGNAGGDQSIFDGGSAGLVRQELANLCNHGAEFQPPG